MNELPTDRCVHIIGSTDEYVFVKTWYFIPCFVGHIYILPSNLVKEDSPRLFTTRELYNPTLFPTQSIYNRWST